MTQLTNGRDTRRIKRKVEPNTQLRAEELLRELREAAVALPAEKHTFQTVADQWLATKIDILDATQYNYVRYIKKMSEFFKDRPFGEITLAVLNQWRTSAAEIWAPVRLNNAIITVRSIFAFAEDNGIITKSPAVRLKTVRLPKERSTKKQPWTPEEMKALLAKAKETNTQLYLIVLIGLETGMRIGEILGLRIIDVQGTAITIVQQVQPAMPEDAAQFSFRKPKSDASQRTVYMSEAAAAQLREYLTTQPKNTYELVFADKKGKPHRYNTIARFLDRIQTSIDIPPRTFHALRGTAASWLSKQGVPLKDIQTMLGHSSASVTLQYYISSSEENRREAPNVISDRIKEDDEESGSH